MALHNDIGRLGEDAACEYLIKHGYRITERNWRLGNIEIDIIAENKTELVFVEVKTRTTTFAFVHVLFRMDIRKGCRECRPPCGGSHRR